MKRDIIVFASIYIIAFAMVFWYGFTHLPVNDGVNEYVNYIENINEGWKFRYSLVNSSVITTLIPAWIQQITGLDKIFVFRIIPDLFYPLMPAFTYLILRKYTVVKYALASTFLVLLNSHFVYFPDIGRVGVALAFMTGMIWALLGKRIIWASIFATLLVFSHYGTSLIAIGLVGAVLVGYFLWQRKILKQYIIVLAILVVLVGIWHYGIARYSGKIMSQTLFQTQQVGQILPLNPNVLDINTREPAVKEAVSINLQMPIPQILEIIFNWLVVLVVSFGVYLVMRRKNIDRIFKLMTLSLFVLIIMTVAIPWLSTYYGGMRVYFTSTPILATSFLIGSEKIADFINMPILFVVILVLVLYGLATSGIIYLPFGLEKTFPVALEMP